jgi:hypothetical protein
LIHWKLEDKKTNFALKCVKSQKSQNLFPVRVKKHAMEVRDEETYFVQHAKTDKGWAIKNVNFVKHWLSLIFLTTNSKVL